MTTIYRRPDDLTWFNRNCDPAILRESQAVMAYMREPFNPALTHEDARKLAQDSDALTCNQALARMQDDPFNARGLTRNVGESIYSAAEQSNMRRVGDLEKALKGSLERESQSLAREVLAKRELASARKNNRLLGWIAIVGAALVVCGCLAAWIWAVTR